MFKVVNIKDFRPSETFADDDEPDAWELHHQLMQACSQLHPEHDGDIVDELLLYFIMEEVDDMELAKIVREIKSKGNKKIRVNLEDL